MHVAALVAVLGVLHRSPHIAPYRLPGTHSGVESILYYSAGSNAPASHKLLAEKSVEKKPTTSAHDVLAAPQQEERQTASAESGSANSLLSGIGDDDITIALEKYFPHPKPDLSVLPDGTRGDVILDGVIDENGRISDLVLKEGLGSAVDDVVIATVKQWTFVPARKHGIPVASRMEFHFHYERG